MDDENLPGTAVGIVLNQEEEILTEVLIMIMLMMEEDEDELTAGGIDETNGVVQSARHGMISVASPVAVVIFHNPVVVRKPEVAVATNRLTNLEGRKALPQNHLALVGHRHSIGAILRTSLIQGP